MNYKILQGNSLEVLKTLEPESINCCITSPPYWGLRDYGTGKWEGGDASCSHKRDSKQSELTQTGHRNLEGAVGDGIYKDICKRCGAIRKDDQIGLELTPKEYVKKMVALFAEVKRVLRKDGTLWLNLGDSYSSGNRKTTTPQTIRGNNNEKAKEATNAQPPVVEGIKQKDLIGIPWRVAFALQEDGWYLRQDIIWHKPNPMPESVTDRCTKAHEYIFLLSKRPNYFFDIEPIREPIKDGTSGKVAVRRAQDSKTRSKEHWMMIPNDLRKGMIQREYGEIKGANKRSVWTINTKPYPEAHFATFPKELIEPCVLAGCPQGGTILDPFGGSGTTAEVALENGRNAILIELNQEYVQIAHNRMKNTQPKLFV